MIKKLIKFVLAGGISFLLNIAITYLLTEVLGIFYLISYSITLTFITFMNFWLNTQFIFKTKTSHKKRFLQYLASVIIFILLNTLVVKVLTENLHIYYILSIVIATAIFTLLKFFTYDKFLFKEN